MFEDGFDDLAATFTWCRCTPSKVFRIVLGNQIVKKTLKAVLTSGFDDTIFVVAYTLRICFFDTTAWRRSQNTDEDISALGVRFSTDVKIDDGKK